MPLYVHNGGLLVRDGALAASAACCCGGEGGGVCCGPACAGSAWGVDFAPSEGMSAAFSAFLEGRGYTNITATTDASSAGWNGQCCKFDFDDTDAFTVTGSGGLNEFTHYVAKCLAAPVEGTNCVEGLTQAECLALSGTPNPAVTCTPDPCGCPEGCPALDGCNFIVVRDFGDTQLEDINVPAGYGDSLACTWSFSIEDLASEQGGDITGLVTIGYDENCQPVIVNTEIVFSAPESAEGFPSVVVSLECNPLP